ncbi:hypothetical protein [Herpetosiphon sp. NSE202]|uniref:hypothetical protein n=1 Tax=Herpetosiphon sp. NSE202 TaxID=3351349 RepID=UPI00362C8DFC
MWHVPSNQPIPSRWKTAMHWFWTLVTARIWLMLASFLWYLDLWRYSMWEWLPRIGAGLLKDPETHALIPS